MTFAGEKSTHNGRVMAYLSFKGGVAMVWTGGTPWAAKGFSIMRGAMILLPLLVLSACGDRKDDQPGVAGNIVNQAMPDGDQVPQGDNIQTAEPLPTVPPAQGPVGATIPAALQGRWVGIDESCADRTTERELTITSASLVFLESEGKATGISTGPNGSIRIDAAFTGEGQSWTKQLELRPSANGNELTVLNDGTAITRKRCS